MDRKLFDAVCDRMSKGDSLRIACESVGVKKSTFLDNAGKDPELSDQYARAREALVDYTADEWLQIVDEEPEYISETISGKNGSTTTKLRIDPASVADKKLRADARQWYLSKLAPKMFGESSKLEIAASLAVNAKVSSFEDRKDD